ncbi:sulfur carrier protein ThiS [Salinibius halmophilus]|uniref:sulfur carrier protein ThiS n=1 Tax=Salinibius halmophilus TaxID=1853216 RepID=UPI000E671625|nr:sulfur carrier protein ThiS [Salinibius halmophilus]
MNILCNGEQLTVLPPHTVASVIDQLNLNNQPIAVAVNQEVIARSNWLSHQLYAGDTLDIFQATLGG